MNLLVNKSTQYSCSVDDADVLSDGPYNDDFLDTPSNHSNDDDDKESNSPSDYSHNDPAQKEDHSSDDPDEEEDADDRNPHNSSLDDNEELPGLLKNDLISILYDEDNAIEKLKVLINKLKPFKNYNCFNTEIDKADTPIIYLMIIQSKWLEVGQFPCPRCCGEAFNSDLRLKDHLEHVHNL